MRYLILLFIFLIITNELLKQGPVTLSGEAHVNDGDTITIHDQRIRLYGIDAPEYLQECGDGTGASWVCGKYATRALRDFIQEDSVTCYEQDIDKHQRIVASCQVREQDIAAWLVSNGWALAYGSGYLNDYEDEQAKAMQAQVGVWRGEFEMPWEWRKQQEPDDGSSLFMDVLF